MNYVVLGNIVCLIGAAIMVLVGLIKNKKRVLVVQCAQFGVFSIGNFFFGLVSGTFSGVIPNVVSIIRNLICLKWNFNWVYKSIFCAIQIGLAWWMGTDSLIAWFPIAAGVLFTIYLDTKNDIVLKVVIIIGEILWFFYDFSNQNYTTVVFDILATITNSIGIFMILHNKKKNLNRNIEREETVQK